MGCRILYDERHEQACLYCSTTETAFGPIFQDGDAEQEYKDASERAEAFCRWLDSESCPWYTYDRHPISGSRHDARDLTESGLSQAYGDWLDQEVEQYKREEAEEAAKYAELDS